MNWTIIIIETIVLTAAFTAMILIPLVKNPVWWIADYPEDIQEEYFKTHERIPSKFFTPTVLLKKGMALLIALALLLVVVKLAGAYDFWSALGVGYGIWLPKEVAEEVPLEKLLIETDCPYLTPHPHRGEKNEPKYICLVAEEIARLKDISKKHVEQVTYENACKLFNIHE